MFRPARSATLAEAPVLWNGQRSAIRDEGPTQVLRESRGGLHLNRYSKSDVRLVQPSYNTDVTLHGVAAEQRTSFHNLYEWPEGYPRLDEPQTSVKICFGDRETNWGTEVGLDHHKYTVQDWKQTVHATGVIAGTPVDQDMPMEDIGWEYQHTNGLNRVGFKVTRAFDLPAPTKDSFSFNTKLGPNVFMLWTKSHLYNHVDGQVEAKTGPFHLGGYGGTWENSVEYAFRNRVSIELFHALTYTNLTDALIPHGHAEQSFWISQVGFTLNKYFNWNSPKHRS